MEQGVRVSNQRGEHAAVKCGAIDDSNIRRPAYTHYDTACLSGSKILYSVVEQENTSAAFAVASPPLSFPLVSVPGTSYSPSIRKNASPPPQKKKISPNKNSATFRNQQGDVVAAQASLIIEAHHRRLLQLLRSLSARRVRRAPYSSVFVPSKETTHTWW